MSWLVKKLRNKITSYGEELNEITLREPCGDDLNKIKAYPYTVCSDGEGEAEFRIKPVLVGMYIEKLAAIPADAVKQIHPADQFEIGMRLMAFFTGGSEGEASSS